MTGESEIPLDVAGTDALAPGSKLLSGQYEILRYLSSGGFGITYLATDSLNRTVVIKECFPEAFCSRVNRTVRARTKNYLEDFQSIVKLFVREAHALSRLNHPSVVGVHQVFEDNETAYMALDLVDGKDLLDIIESGTPQLTPEDVRQLTLKLLDAIAHVHSQDLLHRDISPDNILLDKKRHPVLIDFGAAREEASRKSRVLSAVLVVKDGYSPQEFYVAGSQQHPSSDLYALAATLSHLISGEAPPNSQARLAALAAKQPDLYVPLAGRIPGYDRAFLEAIDKAMAIVPAQRIQTAEEWTLLIDHTKRVEVARAKAQDDKMIDQTVMNLVRAVEEETPPAEASASEAQRTAPTAQRKQQGHTPKKRMQVQPTTSPDPGHSTGFDDLLDDDLSGTAGLAPVPEDLSGGPSQPSPYIRVTSRALEQKKKVQTSKRKLRLLPKPSMRYATVPLVFCAFFFYTHTLLQYDVVQAATVQPLRDLSFDFGSWTEAGFSAVSVRRGVGE